MIEGSSEIAICCNQEFSVGNFQRAKHEMFITARVFEEGKVEGFLQDDVVTITASASSEPSLLMKPDARVSNDSCQHLCEG